MVKPGRVLFEIGGLKEEVALRALRLAAYKLPIQTQTITKGEVGQ
ncbi:MAG TPA: ribosomal protein L16 [Anaerolineae bacterium]